MQVEKNTLSAALTRIVERSTGKLVLSAATLSGGVVADAKHVVLSDGSQVVLKINPASSENADVEGREMEYLQKNSPLPVPKVFYSGADALVHEFVVADGVLDEAAEPEAAEYVAALHDIKSDSYGFDYDTPIVGLRQPNGKSRKWLPFFTEQRLLFSARNATDEGKLPVDMMARIERFAGRIDHYLDEPPYPSLLHGDLWGSTVLCHEGKVRAFVDPALYFGDSEIEFSYSSKHSSFSKAFFDRYNEIRPFRPGYFEARIHIYNLYPLLLHVRMFDPAPYLTRIDAVLKRFGF